jgi:hypothetical protein
MQFYWLILGTLAVWRITYLLQAEDGPGDVSVRIRERAGAGFWGQLLDCFYCLSIWVAAPAALFLGESWIERLWLWPAFSAAAILLERLTQRKFELAAAPYVEDADSHGLLRKTASEPRGGQVPPAET